MDDPVKVTKCRELQRGANVFVGLDERVAGGWSIPLGVAFGPGYALIRLQALNAALALRLSK